MFFAPSKPRQRAEIWIMVVPKTSDHLKINIRMQISSQEPPVSSIAQNEDLKDMDVLCTFKFKIESKNSGHGVSEIIDHIQIKIKMSKPSQKFQCSPKPKIRTLRTCMFFAPSNSRQRAKFGIWVYQRPVTISNSISGCQTPVRNLQRPPKPQIRT